MDLSKKFLNQVKGIMGRRSAPAESSLESDDSHDAQIASDQPSVVGTHFSRGNFPNTIRNKGSSIELTASHFNGERIIGNTKDTPTDNVLAALDLGRYNTEIKCTNNQQDIRDTERSREILGIDQPSTSYNRNRGVEVGNNKALIFPLGWPPGGHASESVRFDGVANSGISIGGGTVSVTNVNNSFRGGTHTQNNAPSERIRPGLELLKERVSPSAFHNSAQRVDPPRCHPDTRVAIQTQIYDWIILQVVARQTWIMWMNGAAGAGKTAIMQSTAERCEKERIAIASFFFFRTDPTRNSMAHFIATLVYQLIQKIPQAKNEIFTIIENNPLIFDESLESQLQKLVIDPLLGLQKRTTRLFVILIDGLDECLERAHQTDLIKLLGTVSRSRSIPVIFLLGSRREPQIEAAFVRKQILDLVLTLALDNSDIEQTSGDIRYFLTDKFHDIAETHLHRRLLPNNWPQESAVEEIVTKSSGQFIYASVVINYVSSPRGNPARLLDIVRGIRLRDPSSHNPFAHLDALYQYIFSQIESLDKVLDILAYILITKEKFATFIEDIFLLEYGELAVYFSDLMAVIACEYNCGPSPEIKFLHASLPDFLRDKTRSEKYHINVEEYTQKLLLGILSREPHIVDPHSQTNHIARNTSRLEYCRLLAIRDLLHSIRWAKASDQLQHSFMTFSSMEFFDENFTQQTPFKDILIVILVYLKTLDFDDQGQAYHHILDMFAAGFAKHWPSIKNHEIDAMKQSPDLLARVGQIRQEL